MKIRKILANIICLFIPSRRLRKTVRYFISGRYDTVKYYQSSFNSAGFFISGGKDGILIEGNGIKIRGQAAYNTVRTCKEVLVNDGYNFPASGSKWAIFDIGANIGSASLYFAKKDFVRSVYSFEPFMPTYSQFADNLKLNPELAEKIIPFDFGLSDHDDTFDIPYNPALPGSMSSIKGSGNHGGLRTEKITIKKASDILAPLFDRHAGDKIMLKIDVEGAEREIIPDLSGSGLLRRANAVRMEYHDGIFKPLTDILQSDGFKIEMITRGATGLINAKK